MKHHRLCLGLLVLVIALSGCISPGGTGDDPDGEDPLIIATDEDPGSAANPYVSAHSKFDWLKDLVYDRLFLPSPYVEEPMPGLATNATQLDPSTWTVDLREGVTWHDGEPFTAQDVVFTYQYYRDGPPTRHTHHVSEAPHIETIRATGEQTVRFECAYPCPTLAQITLPDLPILPEHVWSDVDDPYTYQKLPIGTGPYELVDYQQSEHLSFRAHEGYFLGAPTVDAIEVPIITDHSAIFTALRTGEVDSTTVPVPPELVSTFEDNDAVSVAATSSLSLVEVRVNYDRSPFDNATFRGALSDAVDREAIVDTVKLGMAQPGTQGYPHPASPWTAPDLSTPHQPQQARQTLEQLGYTDRDGDGVREAPNGTELSFTLQVASNRPVWVRAAEIMASQLGEVGMDIEAVSLDSGTIGSLLGSRNFDLYISSITPHGVADPDQFVMSHMSGYLWDGSPYPEWDELHSRWENTTTVDERKEVLFEMQRLFNEQPTSLVLWYEEPRWAYHPAAHDSWTVSPGFGIHHKFSFLPEDAHGTATTRTVP